MKLRHVLLAAAVAVIAIGFLVTCDLFTTPVSIDQRIADFQSDLNNTVRTSAYQNFHPTMTGDYDALKSGTTITTLFPAPDGSGTAYSLTVTDESSPSTAVLVTVSGGPTSYGVTHHLKLVMATYNSVDWRIVSLSMDNGSSVYPGTPQIQ
jgi:hypothetical protein